MGKFKQFLNENRDKSVSIEFRIAVGQLRRMYNKDEQPKEADLLENAKIIAEKNQLDVIEFTEYAKYKIEVVNESEDLDESAVGEKGRTGKADAEAHITDELLNDFKKIVKKLGGKAVAKALVDKLSAKEEIKDEIEDLAKLANSAE